MTTTAARDDICRICGAAALQDLPAFRALGRVTSDCKPWPSGGRLSVCASCGAMQKRPDAIWLGEIKRIYAEYEIYHQSGGVEQPIYDAASPAGVPRSVRLITHLVEMLNLDDTGKLLDFGCGNGVALRNFAKARPGWELFGSELSAQALPRLRGISAFKHLYTCPPDEIPQRFAVITLFHVLEHLLEPVAALKQLRGRIDEGGHLFVEVPDCACTPYDLVVADHMLHFTPDTLKLTAELAGYRLVELSNSIVKKDITLIGRPDQSAQAAPIADPRAAIEMTQNHLAWLEAQIGAAGKIAADSPRFGIFGTSISGTWLYEMLSDRVSFFVDEDPARIDRMHIGLPIYAPADVPADSDVFVPLIPDLAFAVASRLEGGTARFHTPPSVGALTAICAG